MTLKGYAIIKPNPTTGVSPISIDCFSGQTVRVIDFAVEDCGVWCVDNEGTGLASFDMEDVSRYFKCEEYSEVIVPPGLSFIEKAAYHIKVINRKGGFNPMIKQMVIMASLHSGEFNDSLLWARQ